MKNGITSDTNSATKVRQLMAEIVALSKARTGDTSTPNDEMMETQLKVGQKAIVLLAELFGSHVEAKPSDSTEKYPDSHGLGYLRFRDSEVIGLVGHVNGRQAQACPEYAPTRHELQQLAKYWIERSLDLDFYWHHTQCTGSSEWREREFAERRLSRISKVLGRGVVQELEAEVCNELRDRFGAEAWDAFYTPRTS